MTVFDQELRKKVYDYKVENNLKIYEIADMADIERNEFYQFTSGKRPLNGQRIKKLMDALNLRLELISDD